MILSGICGSVAGQPDSKTISRAEQRYIIAELLHLDTLERLVVPYQDSTIQELRISVEAQKARADSLSQAMEICQEQVATIAHDLKLEEDSREKEGEIWAEKLKKERPKKWIWSAFSAALAALATALLMN